MEFIGCIMQPNIFTCIRKISLKTRRILQLLVNNGKLFQPNIHSLAIVEIRWAFWSLCLLTHTRIHVSFESPRDNNPSRSIIGPDPREMETTTVDPVQPNSTTGKQTFGTGVFGSLQAACFSPQQLSRKWGLLWSKKPPRKTSPATGSTMGLRWSCEVSGFWTFTRTM